MTKKRNLTTFMIAIMIMLFSLPVNAQGTVGYVEWDGVNTLTFKGGTSVPTGAYELKTGSDQPDWNRNTNCTTVVFHESFKDVRPTSCYKWFYAFTQLTKIEGIENLNTEEVTNMSSMFRECSSLTSLDLSKFNTAKVTNMFQMFYECSGLTSLNLSNFNTANVTNMSSMFRECSSLTSLDLSKFNTAKVTNMFQMFYECSGLTSLNLSNFNTANVTNMSNMFYNCKELTSLDLLSFRTDKVENMSDMFSYCSSLESLDLSSFNTAKVENMSDMFSYCSSLESLDLSSFNTANVTDMSSMFFNCSTLPSLDVSNFNTEKVKDMGTMFGVCSRLSSLDLSSFNTANVTNMSYMFNYCSKLTSLTLSSFFNTANVTTMISMFSSCRQLTSLDLSNFDTSNVTNMRNMFEGCSGLTSLDLSNFNTAKVTWMDSMFSSCSGLTSLDLSNFDTSNVTSMSQMFKGCSGLTTIYVSDDFKTGIVSSSDKMFSGCSKLVGAASYSNSGITDKSMANYKTGYFKTYYKLGKNQVDLYGVSLTTESLDLSGDDDFVAHAPFTANEATYSRDLSSSNSTWFSLCLPFAYTPANFNFTAYKLQRATADAVEIEEITGEIAAGTPVLFKFKDGEIKKIKISATGANIVKAPVDVAKVTGPDGSSLQLCGTYQTKTFSSDDNNAFILLNDKLMNPAKMPENVTTVGVEHFRAYMTLTASAQTSSARAFSIGRGDEGNEGTTAIDLLNSVATDDAEYYDINGRRIDAPAKGVNIVRRGNKTIKLIIK